MNSDDFMINRRGFVSGTLAALLLAQSAPSGAQANRCPTRTGTGAAANHGEPWGLIEIGSSGVKPSVVRILAGAEPDLEVMPTPTLKNTEANAIDVANAPMVAAAVAEAIANIRALGVPDNLIKIVGSSGVESRPEARDAVAAAVRGQTGLEMSFVTVAQETEYTFDGVVNRVRLAQRRPQVALLDIGSGNTKGCYLVIKANSEEEFRPFSMNLGTKSFARLVTEEQKRSSGENFAQVARRIADTELRGQIREMIVQAGTTLMLRNRVYLNGGLPWAVATTQQPYNTDRYVPLTANDLDTFANVALTDPARLFDVDTARIPAGGHKNLIVGDLGRLSNLAQGGVFTAEEYMAGGALLQVLSEEMALRNKTLFFTRPGRIAWILGLAFNQVQDGKIACEALPAA